MDAQVNYPINFAEKGQRRGHDRANQERDQESHSVDDAHSDHAHADAQVPSWYAK